MDNLLLRMQSNFVPIDKINSDSDLSCPMNWTRNYENTTCSYPGGYFCQPSSERTNRTRLWPDCGQEVPHASSLWPGSATNCSSSVYSSYPSYKEESPLHSLPYSAASLSEQTGAFSQFPLQTAISSGTSKKILAFLRN